jgi:hypothetical protein
MNFGFFLKGIKNLIFNPVKFWETIISERTPASLIRNSFFFPVVILVTVSSFMGSLMFTNAEMSLLYSVLVSIKCLVVILISVYAASFLLGEITFPLDLGKDFNISFSMVVFSITPLLICQIISRLFESLQFINIIGLFGLYIFWTGAEKMMNPPQYKKMPLLISAAVVFAGIYIATDLILTMITDRFYFSVFA